MKILVADDHNLVRAGLTALIARLPDMEIVGEAPDGRQALRMVRDLAPDLVLMDIAMPGLNGLEAAERIHGIHPQTKIIILSMHANEEYVAQALKAGASGYLLKDAATTELEMALKSVSMGQFYLSPAISRQVVDNFLRGGPTGIDVLTPRQREILQLIAEGKSTRDIADTLHLSVKTVETHRAQLMERLDIHDVAGLIRYALKKGLITA
ncbi:MAG TPA: response regulator transcription factor [Gammaproteobacteria bacterium]|nr:response regulator transcription factor [Gammaproteobacteria bacterium]HEV2331842.1 response regulator transcription factor [Gammaproteobacteria bacterium]